MGNMPGRNQLAGGNAFRAIGRLREMRAFERRHLHCLRTVEDRDLVWEIGHHQGRRSPLSLKQVFLLGIASVPTVQRRLRRLVHEGCIQQHRAARDRRTLQLTLSPKVLSVLARYGELLNAP